MVATLGWKLLTCSSKTQRNVTLSSMKSEYVALSACAQEVNFVSMLLREMTEVEKPSVIYEDNQGAIFLAKNRQVGILTKHINIRHHFLRDMAEEKYIDIQYIRSEENPAYIMTKNTLEADFARHMRRTTEGYLWEFVDTGRENVMKTGVKDDVITRDKTEYSSHALTEIVDGRNRNE